MHGKGYSDPKERNIALKATIIVIDDDPGVRETLLELLGKTGAGYNLQTFDCAADAGIHLLNDPASVDLILLDFHMEDTGVNGDQLYVCIRKMHTQVSRVPVIFLTSESRRDEVARLIRLGSDDFILKPFDNKQLLDRIKKCLKKRRRGI